MDGGKIAYTIPGAAEAVSLGKESIRIALAKSQLVAHYMGEKHTKPVILAKDLEAWVQSNPTQRP